MNKKVHITLDAYYDKTVNGKVVLISPEILTTGSGASVIPVEIDILTIETNLISGLSGEAVLIQSQTENTLVVPKKVIVSEGGETFVNVLKEDNKVRVKVIVGIQTEKEVQILSGVSEGDKVLASPK